MDVWFAMLQCKQYSDIGFALLSLNPQAFLPLLFSFIFMLMIQFFAFKKQYANEVILNIPALKIDAGIYWLKGINGSGKSTLLRSLAGLVPFEGKILIDEIDVQKNKRLHRKIINYGEAEPAYPDFLNGEELINFFVETKGGDKALCLKHAQLLHLSDALQKKTGAYSSGMLKKLSLILAFTGEPKWILLDEPLITLDAAAVQVTLSLIAAYYAQGVSILFTSHQDAELPNHGLPLQTLLIKNKTIVAV